MQNLNLNNKENYMQDTKTKICELDLEEKIKLVVEDKDLFVKNFWKFSLTECYIEYGTNLGDFIDDWASCADAKNCFKFLLDSLPYNQGKPLSQGRTDCYYIFDNESLYGYIETFDDEDEWMEAVRQMALEKEVWTYTSSLKYIVEEDELDLETETESETETETESVKVHE